MGASVQRFDLARLGGRLLAILLRILAASWRTRGIEEVLRELGRLQPPLLIGFWHGKYFPLLALFRGVQVTIFAGEGRRGRLIREVAGSFGMSTVLLPHGDREEAVERMRNALHAGRCATAFDGPTGPPRQVKPALLALASETGATILPISVTSRSRLVFGWRWDRREIPLPFAQVTARVGEPILPAALQGGARGARTEPVQAALDALSSPRQGVRQSAVRVAARS